MERILEILIQNFWGVIFFRILYLDLVCVTVAAASSGLILFRTGKKGRGVEFMLLHRTRCRRCLSCLEYFQTIL